MKALRQIGFGGIVGFAVPLVSAAGGGLVDTTWDLPLSIDSDSKEHSDGPAAGY